MKKIKLAFMFILLCASLTFALTSCGEDEHIHIPNSAVKENEIAATCASAGSYDEVVYCAECSEEISRTTKTIEKLSHNASEWITDTEASCKVEGTKHKECTVCHAKLETGKIDKLTTHTPGEAVTENFVDSDCETKGSYNIVTYCSVCNAKISSEEKTVEKKPHTCSNWIIDKNATCKAEGTKHKECTVCHTKLETGKIDKLTTHTHASAVIENKIDSTCSKLGSYDEVIKCSVCGVELSRAKKEISKKNHTPSGWITDTEATCKAEGAKYKECTVCYTKLETGKIDKLTTHTPAESVRENEVAAKCDALGSYDEVIYCSVCVVELSRKLKIIPQEHKFVNDECKFCGNLKSSDGLSFSLNSDEKSYTVVGIGSFKGTSLIVDTYNNLPVTSIAARAFQYCDKLTSVIIGKNVTSIDYEAFKGCSSLENISIPFVGASSTNPGINAHFGYIFGTSHSSNSGSAGYHYSYIGNYGMSYVTYNIPTTLKTVIITGGSSIDAKVFHGCTTLTSVIISSNITLIGDNAFRGCAKIKSITLPIGVESIGENAFRECESLQNVSIPDSITSIGLNAFYGCPIKNAQIPSSAILSINTASNYLESVIITSGDSIGQYSFYNCPKLKSVTISSSVKSIGAYAFGYCKNLTSVVFENPNGWRYASSSSATSATSISATELSDASTAATYLTTTYYSYYWKRN